MANLLGNSKRRIDLKTNEDRLKVCKHLPKPGKGPLAWLQSFKMCCLLQSLSLPLSLALRLGGIAVAADILISG